MHEATVGDESLKYLTDRIREFADERDWGQFHTSKNLAMALAGEVGELLEIFQWLTPEQSAQVMGVPATAEAVRDEVADVLYYLLRLADVLEVDPLQALEAKLAKNAERYPVSESRGVATKYSRLTSAER